MQTIAPRNQMWILLAVNLFVLLIQLVLVAASGSWEAGALLRRMLSSVLYVNVTAIPAMLILPALLEKLVQRGFPILPSTIVSLMVFIPVGCLAAQALLCLFGGLRLQHFWPYYLGTLPPALSAAFIFGLGALMYASMQERLHETEKKLNEKAIMEERAKKLAAEASLRSLESRLHPHFLFNALNSISSLIAEDPALAEKTIGRLAALLRSSLDNTNRRLIPLEQELAMVRGYFEIEEVRFGERFRGTVNVPDDLMGFQVPPLSILSLAENAVKHGISQRRGGGECFVTASSQPGGSLIVEVCDNGSGFSLAAIPEGHGLDNLVERLSALFGERAYLKVFQRTDGCVVQMGIPQ